MTDVRDREPQVELDEVELKQQDIVVPQRRSLVARALAPMRRRSSQELVPAAPYAPAPTTYEAPEPKRGAGRIIILSLILVVLLPTAAAGVYFFAIASNQYVSEARFAVRKAEASASGGLEASGDVSSSSLLSGTTSLAGEDAEIIANYIHSRAAVDDVSRRIDVRAIFQRPEADFWARLPRNASEEQLVKYWNRMVSVYVETTSGIVSVSASAFRREDALALTKAILATSEDLANTLTLKVRADQNRLAEDEVRRSESRVRFALADLTAFRNTQHLIDPVETSTSTGKLLMQLMSDKIETEGRLFVTQHAQGPNAPGINATKARLESINKHISELQDQLAGNKEASTNMAATMSQFEQLELKKEFAEKMLEFARQGLERAQLTSMAQSIYLAVFEPPSLPQDHSFPERYTDFFLCALAFTMTWASGATVTASVLDHRL